MWVRLFHLLELTVAIAPASQNNGQVGVLVRGTIAHTAAEKDSRGIEQSFLTILYAGKSSRELVEVLDLVGLQGDQVSDVFLIVSVVGQTIGLVDAEVLRKGILNLRSRAQVGPSAEPA